MDTETRREREREMKIKTARERERERERERGRAEKQNETNTKNKRIRRGRETHLRTAIEDIRENHHHVLGCFVQNSIDAATAHARWPQAKRNKSEHGKECVGVWVKHTCTNWHA